MAKKRDAPSELLQRLYGYMREHNVDFIGGEFNMNAFFTLGEVFSDTEFSAPGNSSLWGLGALDKPNRECAGFLIEPKRPYEWRVHSHGCYKFDNAPLGLGPRNQSANLPVFLHLRTADLPGPSSVMRSEQAQHTTKNVCKDDVHDRAPVHQGHVSVSFPTLLRLLVSLLLRSCSLYLH